MGGDVRFPWGEAMAVAEELVKTLLPACDRIAVAGSLRREKPDVGDIEILCIPRMDPNALFDNDLLDAAITQLMFAGVLDFRLNTNGSRQYGPQNKLLVHVPSGIPVDVFSTSEENWGMALFIRSGPADWNVKAMQHFRDIGYQGHAYGGVTNRQGIELECPTEEDVFRLLGWSFVPPHQRI